MGSSDKWVGWPYPKWVLVVLLIILIAVGAVGVVVSVQYGGASVVFLLVCGAMGIIFPLLAALLHRRKRMSG